MMPRRAAVEIAPMIATGIAMMSGQGVATTITLRNRTGSPDHHHAAAATASASGVYAAPSRSAIRLRFGRRCSASCITRMMRAYRESAATRDVRMASDESPLIAPDSTVAPGPLEMVNGSPVRYDSSIDPCPSMTSPSTGQISCGSTDSSSPTTTRSTGMSSKTGPARRWAMVGTRRASARSTDAACATANCSSAFPPASISTTTAPARYSPSSTDATMDTPARWSAPKLPCRLRQSRSRTSGRPTMASTARSGALAGAKAGSQPARRTRCAAMPAIASSAASVWSRRFRLRPSCRSSRPAPPRSCTP